MLNIELRPIRYRYPISSEYINDLMDGIYYNMAALLGFECEDGSKDPKGILDTLYSDLDEIISTYTGASALGYTHALSINKGIIDDICIQNNRILHDIRSL